MLQVWCSRLFFNIIIIMIENVFHSFFPGEDITSEIHFTTRGKGGRVEETTKKIRYKK